MQYNAPRLCKARSFNGEEEELSTSNTYDKMEGDEDEAYLPLKTMIWMISTKTEDLVVVVPILL
jgi:hypothetical protein